MTSSCSINGDTICLQKLPSNCDSNTMLYLSEFQLLRTCRSVFPMATHAPVCIFWHGNAMKFTWTIWSTVWSSAPSTSRRSGHSPFVQTGAETFETGAEVVNPPSAPHFCYCRQMSWWVLCSGYKWVSWFEMRAFPLDGQVSAEWSRCPGSMGRRGRDSVALCDEAQQVGCLRRQEDIRWCRTQASSHSSQGVVDDRVNEAGVGTAAPDRSAVVCCWMDQSWSGWW